MIHRLIVVAFVIGGTLVGALLALVTALMLIGAQISAMQTTVNGWSITTTCGKPGDGILVRAACAQALPMVNLPAEAVYWTTTVDGSGQALTGAHDYVLRFPPGGIPPNNAFWSLTMTVAPGRLVANPINRYSLGDRSGLVPNADGSIDVYIQQAAPSGHEANWLPCPSGNFMLWLRDYEPGPAVLRGDYHVPPVVETH